MGAGCSHGDAEIKATTRFKHDAARHHSNEPCGEASHRHGSLPAQRVGHATSDQLPVTIGSSISAVQPHTHASSRSGESHESGLQKGELVLETLEQPQWSTRPCS